MAEQKLSKKEKMKSYMTKRNTLIVVAVLFFGFQFLQIQGIAGTFSFLEGRDTSLITEVGQIKEAYLQIGRDQNEIRAYLGMDPRFYKGFDEPGDDEENNVTTNDLGSALLKYVDNLATSKNIEEKVTRNKAFLDGLPESKAFISFLNEEELTLSPLAFDDTDTSLAILSGGNTLATLHMTFSDGSLFLETSKAKEAYTENHFGDFQDKIIKYLKNNKKELIEHVQKFNKKIEEIEGAINAKETVGLVGSLGLRIEKVEANSGDEVIFEIYNKVDELIGQIVLHKETLAIELLDINEDLLELEVTDIKTALVPFLKKLKVQTVIEKKASSALEELKNTINNEAFRETLKRGGLRISDKPRENNSRIYYDIFSGDKHLSSIVLEKTTGVVNIVNPDGTNSENILYFSPESGSKKKTLEIPENLPEFGNKLSSNKGTFNILIAGKHGSLVDTMIFAHIDEKNRTVKMVSVPRDLFYNGRKINSLVMYYGMPELKRALSEISGYEIDKYVLVDMYAFIDIVDLIGGIDVSLKASVIDPSYKTVDNGVAGTLHYEPGDYHLGGVEALRLARSRKTSSDFVRAERQQMILESIQDKARKFGFGDADTIYQIAKTVLAKTETNVSLDEAIKYYFKYQNFEISSNAVMSSGNVLYVPPYITKENCQTLIAGAAAKGEPRPNCENENQAYTLLPKDNNWNVVKWFFKDQFEDKT